MGMMVSTTKESRRDLVLQQGKRGANPQDFGIEFTLLVGRHCTRCSKGGFAREVEGGGWGAQYNLFLGSIFQQKDADKHP